MKIALEQFGLSRRQTLKWIASAAGIIALWDSRACGSAVSNNGLVEGMGPGIGTDPNLVNPVVPWPRTMTPPELAATRALADVIIPADDRSPSAGSLGCHEFVDEWVSAPYEVQQADRKTVIEGLAWLDAESVRRFTRPFADLGEAQKIAIVEDIDDTKDAKKEFKAASNFFRRMRYLIAGAFYTTPEGMKDVGYVGNVPMLEFPGPPPEVLRHLGLA